LQAVSVSASLPAKFQSGEEKKAVERLLLFVQQRTTGRHKTAAVSAADVAAELSLTVQKASEYLTTLSKAGDLSRVKVNNTTSYQLNPSKFGDN